MFMDGGGLWKVKIEFKMIKWEEVSIMERGGESIILKSGILMVLIIPIVFMLFYFRYCKGFSQIS